MRGKALVLGLAAFVAACSSIRATYDYDVNADFSRMKSYAWIPVPDSDREDPLIVKRVQDAVDRELAAKGLRRSKSNPDFRIAMHTGSQSKIRVTDWGYGYGRGVYWGGGGVDVYQYEEGTLILDFVDARTKKLIWRGTARGTINPDATPEARTKTINEAVAKTLANYPPKR